MLAGYEAMALLRDVLAEELPSIYGGMHAEAASAGKSGGEEFVISYVNDPAALRWFVDEHLRARAGSAGTPRICYRRVTNTRASLWAIQNRIWKSRAALAALGLPLVSVGVNDMANNVTRSSPPRGSSNS